MQNPTATKTLANARAAAAIARGKRRRADAATSLDTTLANIAEAMLGFRTLETANSDGADFREVAVWNLKAALQAAYAAGREAARAEA